MPPAVGTDAAIPIQEGFGTLSRQLENDENYNSSSPAVSGPYSAGQLSEPRGSHLGYEFGCRGIRRQLLLGNYDVVPVLQRA